MEIVLEGVGLSVIDNEPKELIYVKANHFKLLLNQEEFTIIEEDNKIKETATSIELTLGNFQIDNLTSI